MPSIKEIYGALEARLENEFSGYSFFRRKNTAKSGLQNKASVPSLCLTIQNNQTSRTNTTWLYAETLRLELEVRFEATSDDLNDITRIDEQSDSADKVRRAIYPQSGEADYLDQVGIENIRLDIRPLNITAIELKNQNGILALIDVEYVGSM